ncbi:cupin domain-containing protein [Syntrophomonas palmitatica]|uniref:cupin domain-containing protein n=1 Tax=Syntrophomonas palmitatica TaxID=402877 RepID=UPI0006D21170|nr:cupin domain-containing protein [Syntrophomonas palmitatica]
MFVGHAKDIAQIKVQTAGASGVIKQSLVGPEQGWEGWVMRLFTLGPNGYSPRHAHAWPHINYIVSGQGTLFLEGQEYPFEKGSIAYIPANAIHQFLNRGEEDFVFICIVPKEGDK